MNDNKKGGKRRNKYYAFKSIYIIRKNYPKSKTFYIIMFFFKYLGIISNSRIIETCFKEKNLSINRYISNFFIFGKNFSAIYAKYQLISIIGAIIFLISIIFTISSYIFMHSRYKNVHSLIGEKMKNKEKKIKVEEILFKIITYISVFVVFFHQYIIEYYSFGVYGFIYYQTGLFTKNGNFPSIYVDDLHKNLYDYFQLNNHLLIFIVNLIVIFLVINYLFIFLVFNTTKSLFLLYGIPYSGNIIYLLMKIIILSFQPFYAITNLYKDETKIKIGIMLNIIIIILCIINFWSCFHHFGYYPNTLTNLSLFIEFFIYISSIIEILLYFSQNKNDIIFIFIKISIEVINAIFIMKLFLFFRDKYNLYHFSKNLFSKSNSKISIGGLYYYFRNFLEYKEDKLNKYQKMLLFIELHIQNCKKIDCPEHALIKKLNNHIKISKNDSTNYSEDEGDKNENNFLINKTKTIKDKIKNNKLKFLNINNINSKIYSNEKIELSEKEFQIIFEQEIINRINYLFECKRYRKMENYIFIHLQYLLVIKKNYYLTLYYVGKYSSCGIKWSLMTQYFFFEYKKFLFEVFYSKTNINNVDENVNKFRKDNSNMQNIINHFIFSTLLKNLIISSCYNLKILFNYRKELHSPIALQVYKRSQTRKLLITGQKLKKNIDKVLNLLHENVIEKNHKIISVELSYIIINFYVFIEGRVPYDLKNFLNPAHDIISIANKLNEDYKFLNLVHPLILSLTKTNSFKISYLSTVISNRLGYSISELKFKDFHEKLFPGTHFIKQHELLMKQFLFFDYNSFSKNNTFLKTKEGYLMGIKFTARKFPTFFDDFYIIIGIDFINDIYDLENDNKFNRYSFLLDENFEFMSQTINFYEDFMFNIPMFKELKINFLKFFSVNKNKLIHNLKEKNSNLFKNDINSNNIINLRREDDAFTVFKNINYENIFELRDISKLESISKESIRFKDKIEKEKILKKLPDISKLIEEYGLDFEWYQRIDNLKQRLTMGEIKKEGERLTQYTKNIVSLGYSLNPIKSNKNLSSIYSNKSLDKNSRILNSKIPVNNSVINREYNLSSLSVVNIMNISEEDTSKKLTVIQSEIVTISNNFDVVYTIRRIGPIYYFIVDLYELILNKKKLDDDRKKYEASSSLRRSNEMGSSRYNDNYNSDVKNKDYYYNSKILKSKTLFADIRQKKNDLINLINQPINSILIEEESSIIEKNKLNKEQIKTLEMINHKNNIIKKYLNKKDYVRNEISNIYHKSTNQFIKRINLNSLDRPNKLLKGNRKILSSKFMPISSKDITISINNNLDNKNTVDNKTTDNDNTNNDNNDNNNNNDNNINNNDDNANNNKIITNDNSNNNDNKNNSNDNKNNNNDNKIKNKDENHHIHKKKNLNLDIELSLISKDKLEKLIKKTYQNNHYLLPSIFILFIINFILITIKLLLSQTSFSYNSNLSKGMILVEEMKSDIYIGSILVLSKCFRNKPDEIPEGLTGLDKQMIIKSQDLLGRLNNFIKNIKLIHKNNLSSKIIDYLYKNITITLLDFDWTEIKDSSYFIKEVNHFCYLLNENSVQNPDNIKCDFENNIYLLGFNTSKEIYNSNNNTSPTFNQRFIFYIIKNIINTIKPLFFNILNEINLVQIKIMNSYYSKVIWIWIFLLIFSFISEVLILLKIMEDNNLMKKIFIYLYHYEKKEIQFEFEINYLEITVKEFNLNNLLLLENLKRYKYYYLHLIQSNNSKNNENNNIVDNNNVENNLIEMNKNNNNSNLLNNKKVGNNDLSISGSFLNSSINNSSSIQFLNKNNNNNNNNEIIKLNKDKKDKNDKKVNKGSQSSTKLNNLKKNIKKINEKVKDKIKMNEPLNEEEMVKDNEYTLNMIINHKKLVPKTILISIYFSITIYLIYILIIIENIINVSQMRNIWEYSIYLSMNYLEKITKIIELCLSTYLTVIMGKFDIFEYYSTQEYKNKQINFIRYFSSIKNYDSSELISENVKDSFFANQLYDSLKIKKNLEYCEKHDDIKNYFKETQKVKAKLNEKNSFCINSSLYSMVFYNGWIKLLETYYNYIDQFATACIKENSKIDETGLDLEIDFILHEINYLYMDFIEGIKINISQARKNFFENSHFKRMLRDLNIPFTFALGSYYMSVINDMINLIKSVKSQELFFISTFYLIDLLFFLFLIYISTFNSKDKKILIFLSKILKNN